MFACEICVNILHQTKTKNNILKEKNVNPKIYNEIGLDPLNKSRRHFEYLISDVIRGKIPGAILFVLIARDSCCDVYRCVRKFRRKVSLNSCVPFLFVE